MIRKIVAFTLFLLISFSGFSQTTEFSIAADKKPLNELLVGLRSQYGFQLSFNDKKLSEYTITANRTFSSEEDLLLFLIKGLPFDLKHTGSVYIIVPKKEKKTKKELIKTTIISGNVVEAGSLEALPFSHIQVNNHALVSDVVGSFSYTSTADTSFRIRISHIGYYIYDTLVFAETGQQFQLVPLSEELPEIIVQNNVIEKATLVGEKPGEIKINHNISRFLPGQGDNSVFNLIRLMPGVLASGEQATDLLIWGSYEGQSQVIFDGFTLFGLKNYNDNISVINPFVVKNIELYKGGFDARYGNRVGGLVNITGKNGNLQKPVFSFNVNPTTASLMLEIPSFQNSSILVAYRQTYYNLYSASDFNIFAPTQPGSGNEKSNNRFNFDFDVYPDNYSFQDFNMKYSTLLNNTDQFYISLYGGGDQFKIAAETETERFGKRQNGSWGTVPYLMKFVNSEYNQQLGGSIFYNRNWSNINNSTFSFSHSAYSKKVSDEFELKNLLTDEASSNNLSGIWNKAKEYALRNQNTVNFYLGHKLEFGASFLVNNTSITNSLNSKPGLQLDTTQTFESLRMLLFAQDHLPIGEKVTLKTGMRLTYQFKIQKAQVEPRFSISYKPVKNATINASWGLYNQYMYKMTNVDKDQNYTWLWVTVNDRIPVLRATHYVLGLNYSNNNLTFNIETFYKRTRNLTRRYYGSRTINNRIIEGYLYSFGDARAYGVDIYVKKDFGGNSVWASYSLSKAEERLAPLTEALPDYSAAPHDQRHEFKIAGIYNLGKFFISANYVYGSGMELIKQVFANETGNVFYSRFDAAVTYQFRPWGKNFEAGFSVLNIFDTQNLKYANMKKIVITQNIGSVSVYSNAVPFTPMLFLKVIL
ncbi:MAG: TonB-dependent receptor [Prolixibacteraceae bacterium]|nr:TonB-dependent receptor [Prolixibacteraceae bacterium]